MTLANGRYVANMCIGCHQADLSGGRIAGGPPDWPAAADIRPGAPAMARYATPEHFVAMLRSGKRPDDTPIQVMPFESLGQLSDTDARALHLYLSSPAGERSLSGAAGGGGNGLAAGGAGGAAPLPSGAGGLRLPG